MLSPVGAGIATSEQVVTADNITSFVNIRAEPTSASPVMGELRPGQSATLVGESRRWYKIALPGGVTGFVHRHWTEKVSEAPPKADVGLVESGSAAAGVRVSSVADAAHAPSGAAFQIIPAESVRKFVNVRARPTVDSVVIGELAAGTAATLLNESRRWFEIELAGGVTGFVHTQWTEKLIAVASDSGTLAGKVKAEAEPKRDRSVLARPATLLKDGRARDAYRLLSKLELEWAGDTGFDYLYGLAALDSGHPGEAIFALERVVKLLPKFTGARMELARALFNVGDHDLAEKEFVKLLDKEPPEEVRNIIMAFLDIIRNPPVQEDPSLGLYYLLASSGYDSNANGAADIDNFLGFSLDPRSTEQDSPFVEAALGGIMKRPLRPGLDLLLGADAKTRSNRDAGYVDNSFVAGNATLAFVKGDNEINAGIAATWSEIDGSFNERGFALNVGYTRPLPNERALRFTMGVGPVEYTDALKARDLDMRLLYSLTIRRPILDGDGDFDWSLIGGRDLAKDRTTTYSNSRIGGRIGGRVNMRGNDMFWGLGVMKIPYNGAPFFDIDRKDTQYSSNFAIELADIPAKGWTLVPNISFIRNQSNVAIYDNDRVQIGVQVRTVR